MSSSDKELELLLMETGNRLLEPPSSVDELITLIDQVESFLSRVEQAPSQSMQNALSPSLKALIGEQLFRHPDADVKVAVAACISEITRITAPDAPYNDDQMREIFRLIVSSFENLADKSSRSHTKRTSILETVAKVRSCVVMLDLECDALIIEMFQHFLNAIRDYHADTVFTSMLTIMTLVLEESEDISMELLSPILARVKRDNEEVLPIARKLAKSVLENCASKLKPYLTQAVENLGIAYEDYSGVVASICQVVPNAVVQNDDATDKCVDVESKPAEAPLDNAVQEEIPKESVLTEQVDHANEKSPISVVSNGIIQTDENNSLPDSNSLQKQEDVCLANKSENVDTSTVAEPDGLEVEKVVISDSKLEKSTDEKGGKSHSKSTEPSDSTHDGKEVETLADQKDDCEDDAHPSCEDPSVDGAVSTENRRETDVHPSLTKITTDEPNDVASPAPSGAVHDGCHSIKVARPQKKDGLSKITPSVDNVSKKSTEVPIDSEAKTNKRPGKKVASAVLNKDEEMVGSPKAVKSNKLDSHMEETSKTNSKRKHTPSKEKGSDTLEYGENLVGLKVKVWWPKDHAFYDGVIQSFDPTKKKHKVFYDDGDVEILNLKKEKWEVIKDESGPDEEVAADRPSSDGLSEISQKKAKADDQPRKKAKMDASPKRGGGASSGKSKGAAMRSGRKIKEDGTKVDGSKKFDKSDNVTKAEDHTPESGSRPVDVTSKVGSKSKNEDSVDTPKDVDTPKCTEPKVADVVTPEATTKPKQDTAKTAKTKQEAPTVSSNSKGNPLKSGGKSDANGGGKSKSGSSKVKESTSMKENSADSAEVVEALKRKAPSSSSKGQGTDPKSVKKRREEAKATSTPES